MGERYAWRGRYLNVRIDEIEAGNRTWEVVERPASVAVIALTTGDELLLVRQRRQPVRRETIELPAGIIESGETPEDTAHRELIEETAYRPGALRHIAMLYSSPGFTDEQIFLLLATECEPLPERQRNPSTELLLATRCDVTSLLDDQSGQGIDGKTFAGLSWLLRHWETITA